MKKQKIKAENLYREPLRSAKAEAISSANLKDSLSRFLFENYDGAHTFQADGRFDGFLRLVPAAAASFFASVFRAVSLSEMIDVNVTCGDILSLCVSFPDSVKVDRETAQNWIKLAESAGFDIVTSVKDRRVVLCVSARVYVFTPAVRAATARFNFYEALCEANAALSRKA